MQETEARVTIMYNKQVLTVFKLCFLKYWLENIYFDFIEIILRGAMMARLSIGQWGPVGWSDSFRI